MRYPARSMQLGQEPLPVLEVSTTRLPSFTMISYSECLGGENPIFLSPFEVVHHHKIFGTLPNNIVGVANFPGNTQIVPILFQDWKLGSINMDFETVSGHCSVLCGGE